MLNWKVISLILILSQKYYWFSDVIDKIPVPQMQHVHLFIFNRRAVIPFSGKHCTVKWSIDSRDQWQMRANGWTGDDDDDREERRRGEDATEVIRNL